MSFSGAQFPAIIAKRIEIIIKAVVFVGIVPLLLRHLPVSDKKVKTILDKIR